MIAFRPGYHLMPPVRLRIPACTAAIACAQHTVQWFVEQARMQKRQRFAINLAIEELILTLLRYAFDDGREEGELELTIELRPTLLTVEVCCRGMPFDLSLVPEYDPDASPDDASLSVLLLKHMVDRYHLHNEGKDGYRIELEWLRPLTHVSEMEEPARPQAAGDAGQAIASPVAEIRRMQEEEALALARLIYRSYGYSYVSDYLYYPERIVDRLREGLLHSWVAVSKDGELAGHAALVLSSPQAAAVEWSIGVVDPRWRGQGLLKHISVEIINQAAETAASVVFVHAVTNHPHTQKSSLELAMLPTALLLGFAPASLEFRHIHDKLSQRESTFIAVRLLKPLPPHPVHLPPRHADLLRRVAAGAGIPLTEAAQRAAAANQTEGNPAGSPPALPATSTLDTMIEPAVNVAIVNLTQVGEDLAAALAAERRRLCREKVDVIFLNVDLSDPRSTLAVDIAEADGFFLAGLTPMQPWPYTLTLQYLNNLEFDYDAIHAVGELAQLLKEYVRLEQVRIGG